MKTYEKIEMNPKIMFGKPVIKNTRITVEHILRKLSGGMTIEANWNLIIPSHRPSGDGCGSGGSRSVQR